MNTNQQSIQQNSQQQQSNMKSDLNMGANSFQMNTGSQSFSLGAGEFNPTSANFVPNQQQQYNQYPPQQNQYIPPMQMNQGYGNQFGQMPPPPMQNQFMGNMGINPSPFPNSSFGGYNNYGMKPQSYQNQGYNPNYNRQPMGGNQNGYNQQHRSRQNSNNIQGQPGSQQNQQTSQPGSQPQGNPNQYQPKNMGKPSGVPQGGMNLMNTGSTVFKPSVAAPAFNPSGFTMPNPGQTALNQWTPDTSNDQASKGQMGFKIENQGKPMQGSIIQQPQQPASTGSNFFINNKFNVSASEFVPSFTPKKDPAPVEEDPLTKALKTRDISGEDLDKIKELVAKIKQNKESKAEGASQSGLSLDILHSLNETKLATQEQQGGSADGVNKDTLDRQIETKESEVKKGGQNYQRKQGGDRGRGGYQNRGNYQGQNNDNFNKGQNYKQGRKNKDDDDFKIQRPQDSELKKKLMDNAKLSIQAARGQKDDTQKIKLILNQLAPDNYDELYSRLKTHIFDDCLCKDDEGYTEEKKLSKNLEEDKNTNTFVNNIFRKAEIEKNYCGIYGNLVETIIKLELKLKDIDVLKKNYKESKIRTLLLTQCRQRFEQFFNEEENKKAQENLDSQFKYRDRLFGNIKFVGELNIRGLLHDAIIHTVFKTLLLESEDTQTVDAKTKEYCVEGAIHLIEKIGYHVDEKVDKFRKSEKNSNNKLIAQMDHVYARFKELSDKDLVNDVPMRIKLLITNMLDDQTQNWTKSKQNQDKGPKKLEEIKKEYEEKAAKEAERKAKLEEQKNQYNQGGRGGRQSQSYYQQKNYDQNRPRDGGKHNKQRSNYNDNQDQGTTEIVIQKKSSSTTQEPQKAEYIEIEDSEAQDFMKQAFSAFYRVDEDGEPVNEDGEEQPQQPKFKLDFTDVKKLISVNGRPGNELIALLLNVVYDGNYQQDIKPNLPSFLLELYKNKVISEQDLVRGINSFIQNCDMIGSDYPLMAGWFYRSVVEGLMNEGILKINSFAWEKDQTKSEGGEDEEEDDDEVDVRLKIFSIVVARQFVKADHDMGKLLASAEWTGNLSKVAEKLLSKAMDYIFDDIKNQFDEEELEALLGGHKDKFLDGFLVELKKFPLSE